jgi:hypothetical protein
LNLLSFNLLHGTGTEYPASYTLPDTAAVLQHVWLRLGLVLLQQLSVPQEELQEEEGDETAASSSSSQGVSSRAPRAVDFGLACAEGRRLDVPAAAGAQLDMMWSRYSAALWKTLNWYEGKKAWRPANAFNACVCRTLHTWDGLGFRTWWLTPLSPQQA